MTCEQNAQTQGYCAPHAFSSSTNQITNGGFTYDASGDLTADGTHTYQYDAEGRLISVDNGSTASYVYNALGERVEKDVSGTYTEYAFDKDGEPEAENNRGTTNNGWVDSWVYFEGQHIAHYENGGVYYTYSNQVGTAGVVTDWTGAVVQDELHYPWGQVWTTMGTQTEERFASLHHRDSATNLDPTHFRMYSSDEGRWLTPDPAKNCPYHPENFDRYNYADNNPTNRTDPRGSAVYGIDYPYIDYGLGLDAQFLPNPYAYGLPPLAGLMGPLPNGHEIACLFCLAEAKADYAARRSMCFTAYMMRASGGLYGAVMGIYTYDQCVDAAASRYATDLGECMDGPCNPENDLPALPF